MVGRRARVRKEGEETWDSWQLQAWEFYAKRRIYAEVKFSVRRFHVEVRRSYRNQPSKLILKSFCTNWLGSNVYNSSSIWSFSTRFFAVSSLFSSLSAKYNYKLQKCLYVGLIYNFHKLTNL